MQLAESTPGSRIERARNYLRTHRDTLGVTLLRSLPLIVAVAGTMWVLESFGFMSGVENFGLDSVLRLNDGPQSRDIVLLTITDADYARHFDGRSPLEPAKVAEAIRMLAAGRPRVIAVDLDTSHPSFQDQLADLPDNVVLARPGRASESNDQHVAIVPQPLLGKAITPQDMRDYDPAHDPPPEQVRPRWGLAVLPFDADGVIRRFWVRVPGEIPDKPAPDKESHAKESHGQHADGGHGSIHAPLDSFPTAIVRAYCDQFKADKLPQPAAQNNLRELEHATADGHSLPIINFSYSPDRFAVITYGDLVREASLPAWQTNSRVKDKIVILGGTYSAARDEYATPVGLRSGVSLVAEVVDAICHNQAIVPASHRLAFFTDIAMGLALVALNWRFRFRFSAIVNVFVIIALSLLGSLLAYHALAFWFNFMAVLVAVWIHVLIDHVHEKKELEHEVALYREKFGPLHHGH